MQSLDLLDPTFIPLHMLPSYSMGSSNDLGFSYHSYLNFHSCLEWYNYTVFFLKVNEEFKIIYFYDLLSFQISVHRSEIGYNNSSQDSILRILCFLG